MLRAAGMLGALIAAGGPAAIIAQQSARAQNDPEPLPGRSVDWVEADNVGIASADGFTTIATDFPISAVGAHWPGSVGSWPVVEVQLSLDGVEYTESFFLHADADIGRETRDNRVFTTLVMSGGAQYIRFRVVDANGSPQVMTSPEIA